MPFSLLRSAASASSIGSERFNKLLDQVETLRQSNKAVQEAYDRIPDSTKPADIREEALAYIVEKYPEHSLTRRFIAQVRAWLHEKGILNTSRLTDADLGAIGLNALKSTARGEVSGPLTGEGRGMAAKVSEETKGVVTEYNDNLDKLNNKLKNTDGDKITQHYIFHLGRPSKILTDTGIPDLPMKIRQDVVRKAIGEDSSKKHDLPIELLYNLPKHINNPIAVFTSDTQLNAKTLLLQFRHKGKPVMAAIDLNVEGGNINVNKITSVYERNEIEYVNWVNKGRLDSLDKQKGQWLLERLRRVIRPETSGSLTPNKILYHSSEYVKSGIRDDIDGTNVKFSRSPEQREVEEAHRDIMDDAIKNMRPGTYKSDDGQGNTIELTIKEATQVLTRLSNKAKSNPTVQNATSAFAAATDGLARLAEGNTFKRIVLPIAISRSCNDWADSSFPPVQGIVDKG
ncbi:MAG: hypothetical protein WCP20_10035 [Desulfuromonadales bacterium]